MLAIETFELKPSLSLLSFYSFIILGSVIMVLITDMLWLMKGLLLLLIFIYSSLIVWKVIWMRGKETIVRIDYHAGQGWYIWLNQQKYFAHLLGESTTTPFLNVLRFQILNQTVKRTSIVCWDSLSPHLYRKLIMLVRFGNH